MSVYVYHVVYLSVQLFLSPFPELIYVHNFEWKNLTGCNEFQFNAWNCV